MIVLDTLLPVFIIIAIGYGLEKLHSMEAKTLSELAIYVLTPALVFDQLLDTPLRSLTALAIVAYGILFAAAMGFISYIAARLLKMNQLQCHSFCLSTVLINHGNMGLPIILFAYGDAGLKVAIVFFIVYLIITHTVGVSLAAGARKSWLPAVFEVFRLPIVYVIVAAVAANTLHWDIPPMIRRPVGLLGAAAIPLSTLLLGVQLANTRMAGELRNVTSATLLRLLGSPVLGWMLTTALGISGLAQKVVILQTSMPSAVYSVILATKFDVNPDFVSSVALVSTATSALTLSVLLLVMH